MYSGNEFMHHTISSPVAVLGLLSNIIFTSIGAIAQEVRSPADIPVEAFAQLPAVSGMELSPDGTHLAYLTPRDGRQHLRIQSLDGAYALMIPPIDDADIAWFRWANAERLVLSYTFSGKRSLVQARGAGTNAAQRNFELMGTSNIESSQARTMIRTRETRLFSINFKTKESVDLIKLGMAKVTGSRTARNTVTAQIQDDVIDWLPDDPEHILLSIDSDWDFENEVRRIDITNGEFDELQEGSRGIQNWMTDQSHQLRYGSANGDNVSRNIFYSTNERTWKGVDHTDWSQQRLTPVAFEADPRFALAMGQNSEGRAAVFRIDLESGSVLESVFSHPVVDIGEVLLDDQTKKPIGFSYTVDQPRIQYLDEDEDRLQQMIDGALPGFVNRVVSRVEASRMFLISSRNDIEPGVYYLLDRNANQMHFMAEAMPGLSQELLSPMQAIKYAARDGQEIPGYLTTPKGAEAKNLPVVVLPHAGPHKRDVQMFSYLAQFLASRGYAVLQPNFRGSTGYGQAFRDAGENQWGGAMQDDLTDGAQWLIKNGVADPARICIAGHSYGGYAAIIGAGKTPKQFACAVSVNGIFDLPALVADTDRFAGAGEWTESLGITGHKVMGVSPMDLAEAIEIPILIVHAKNDYNVPYKRAQTAVKRLKRLKKKVTFVTLDDGDHNLDTEASRLAALMAMEAFLAKHIGR